MNDLTTATSGATISSVELVAIINNLRESHRAELRHDSFMTKVGTVLGEGCPKFSGHYFHPQNGQKYRCYYLPKREALLMLMSESYAIQAKVYDRMIVLEGQIAAQAPKTLLEALVLATEKQLRLEEVQRQNACNFSKVEAGEAVVSDRSAIFDPFFQLL